MPYYVHDKIISPNIWDEQWENGYIITSGNKASDPDRIRSKNFITVTPNTNYYIYNSGNRGSQIAFYDKNNNFILRDTPTNNIFTTPENCAYILFSMVSSYGATYNHDICINVSNPTINGHYYPYNMGAKKYVIKDNNNSMNIGG